MRGLYRNQAAPTKLLRPRVLVATHKTETVGTRNATTRAWNTTQDDMLPRRVFTKPTVSFGVPPRLAICTAGAEDTPIENTTH